MTDKITFSFGRNWAEFVRTSFSEQRVATAQRHILDFLETPSLEGRYFLDVGCGSGLSSLAALGAGAARIVSFDVDPASVETTRRLRQSAGEPEHWTVLEGSVLDEGFLARIEPADLVYSWGVLHHTGDMWRAIRNAGGLVAPRGSFYIALYGPTSRPDYWLALKRRYNRASPMGKRLLEAYYVARHEVAPRLARLRNPVSHIRQYGKTRGMDFMTDVRDWLGGYPYEEAAIPDVVRFFRKELRAELVNLQMIELLAEYLFVRK